MSCIKNNLTNLFQLIHKSKFNFSLIISNNSINSFVIISIAVSSLITMKQKELDKKIERPTGDSGNQMFSYATTKALKFK